MYVQIYPTNTVEKTRAILIIIFLYRNDSFVFISTVNGND